MADLQVLREKRQALKGKIEETRVLIDSRRSDEKHTGEPLNAEERSAFKKVKDEFVSLKSQIEAEECAADVQTLLADEVEAEERQRRGAGGTLDPDADDRVPGTQTPYGDVASGRDARRQLARAEERRALIFAAWATQGVPGFEPTEEMQKAIAESRQAVPSGFSIRPFDNTELRECRQATRGFKEERSREQGQRAVGRLTERRAVVAGATAQSHLAPQVTVQAFEEALLTIGGIYGVADVMVTPTGAKTTWPTGNDTSNEGKQIDEVTAQPLDGVAPDMDSFSVASYEFWSDFIRIGYVTMRDSPVSLAAIIGNMIGERLGRVINRKATYGDGAGTLRGIEMGTVLGRAMAGPSTYAWEDLYKLKFSVEGAYRNVGTFMMSDEVLVEQMLLTDNNGKPVLIEPNDGSLPRLLNRPVQTNNHMAAVADVSATRPAMIFGDLSKYKLRLVGDVRMGKLIERFTEFDQVGFDGKRGADGGLLNAGTNPVKSLAPAA